MTDSLEYRPPTRSAAPVNIPALMSITTGAISCLPFVGLVTIPLAILGLRRAKERGGRAIAIGGLLLGMIGLAWTAVLLLGIIPYAARSWQASAPARRSAETFMIELSKGRIDDAMMRTGESIERADLDAIYGRLAPLGEFKGLSFGTSRLAEKPGSETFLGRGTLVFDRAEPPFEIFLVRKGGMMYVDRVKVDEPLIVRAPATQQVTP